MRYKLNYKFLASDYSIMNICIVMFTTVRFNKHSVYLKTLGGRHLSKSGRKNDAQIFFRNLFLNLTFLNFATKNKSEPFLTLSRSKSRVY